VVSITICYPEWSDIKYTWKPSPIYQTMISLVVVFPSGDCITSIRYPFTRRRLRRMRQTLDWGICNSWLARCVDFWGLLTKVSRTRSTVSVDGPRPPVGFAALRQSFCWNFLYHSRIVLSICDSVWYLVRNLRYTVTIDSVLANSKTQNAFLSPILAMFRHDCPLAVKSASTPRRQLPK
jgi:hypothetical protein